MDQGLDRLERLLKKRLRSGSLADLRVEPPRRRARLILEATALYYEPAFTQTELASILGMSRSAFRRELVRLWRGYFEDRDCVTCGEPLPPESTQRRKFCSVRCRVAYNRRPDTPVASEDSNVNFIISAIRQIGIRLEEGYTVDQVAQEIGMPKQDVIRVRRKLHELVDTPSWRPAWEKMAAEAQKGT